MALLDHRTGKLLPQSLLHQRYLIVGIAGRGGMGAVYRAVDTHAGQRLVAVKELSQGPMRAPEQTEAEARFQQEAWLLRSLVHPNLPHFHDAFHEGGRAYLVMDFIEGKTLHQLLQEAGGRPLPIEQVLHYAGQLCEVLLYLHQHQPPIIFRDLKPENVMVTAQNQVVLIDFGIARFFKEGQRQDTLLLGSPGYAAPEQHGLSQTSPRSDLYSLGATLHHCLTGKDPFSAQPRFVFPAIRQINPQVPQELEALIQRLVALDASQRPESAAEVLRMLAAIRLQSSAPTDALTSSLAATQYVPQSARPAAAPARPHIRQAAPASSIWTPAFALVFGLLLVVLVGGSTLAFNLIVASDHLVEAALALLLLPLSIVACLVIRRLWPGILLALTGLLALVPAGGFLVQAFMPRIQETLARLLPQATASTSVSGAIINQVLTGGLLLVCVVAFLWHLRPFRIEDRLVLLLVFGLALAGALAQYPLSDDSVSKHLLLVIVLISLNQGLLLAVEMERVSRQKQKRIPHP